MTGVTSASRRERSRTAETWRDLGLLLFLAFAWGGCRAPEEPKAIIVVDVDTLRADHLGGYGYKRETSPNLDAFARGGTRFDWAFSQAPYTLPSQTSILTSLYPSTHRVLHDSDRLGPERTTLAERFLAAGFATGAFVDGGFLKAHFGLDQGFQSYFDLNGGGVREAELRVEDWLRTHRDERFFLFLHTYDVHSPYAPPSPFKERFAGLVARPTPGFEPTSAELEAVRLSQYTATPITLPERDIEYSKALYDGEIAYVDAWFGRLLATLERLGLRSTTLVAVVSDHGEEFGEHGSVLHEKVYSSVTRIPLILAGPGVAADRSVATTVQAIDLAPTLLDLAGVGAEPSDKSTGRDSGSGSPHPFEGRSLVSLLNGGEDLETDPGLAVIESPFFGIQRSWVDDSHRLILSLATGRLELYRYREDLKEQHDLAGAEPTELRRTLSSLKKWNRPRPVPELMENERVALPPEVEESLRSLGYLK